MQHRLEGDVRIVRQRISQRQGAMGGELGHQPIGQRTDGFVLVRRVRLGTRRRAADGDDGPLDERRWFGGDVAVRHRRRRLRTGSTGASSSGRTKPRSMRSAPSLSMLTKMPARAISAGS